MEDSKTIELIMKMSDNVAEIKSDMKHVVREVEDLKVKMSDKNAAVNKRISDVEKSVNSRIKELEDTVEELKDKENKEDATKWRKATGYVLAILGTTVVTFVFSHIGDLIKAFGGN